MTTDKTPIPGPDATTTPALKQLTDYTDAELIEALDNASQHISGKAWTVTALAGEMIRRANEKNGDAA